MMSVTFYNGNEYPILGLGTWKSDLGEVTQAVKDAIDVGYRHIDCAHVYGNEKKVGEAFKEIIDEGIVKREELFVTSKLWSTKSRPALVESALRNTLQDLCLDYLDLYLIHWPQAFKEGDELYPTGSDGKMEMSDVDYVDTWKEMEGLVEKGLVKNIGISNFNSRQMERLLSNCKIKPVTNQIECHPYLPQLELSEFCKSKGIAVTAYSPLGSPDNAWSRRKDHLLLEEQTLQSIAAKYDKTPAQVALRYHIDRGHIVIPKSVTKSRMEENINIFDFELSPEDIEELHSMDCNDRKCTMDSCEGQENYPFGEDF